MRTSSSRAPLAGIVLLSAAVAFVSVGCSNGTKEQKKLEVAPKYESLPPREVPDWLKGSIMEQVDLAAVEPYRVSNFGLVMLPRPTGDAQNTPNSVREYMIREMVKRGFGSKNLPGFENATPEQILRDPRFAIVRVDALIPPGATTDQRIDAQVSVLPDSNTTSLAGGTLYLTDLVYQGANYLSPGTGIDVLANARGYIFVNPAYALDPNTDDASQRRSLTSGIILNGARINQDRPIGLRIRAAERRLSRMTERRIDLLLASDNAASAKDEGMVFANVPAKYRGDWEHYAGVVLHTFYNAEPAFVATKAKQLAAEAVKPDALLLDISYSIEALGQAAIPHVEHLLTHPQPDVAFAVARALAWIGDGAAEVALGNIARDASNPYRANAVQTLANLPPTPAVNMHLRDLMNVTDAVVRVEAYKGLVRNDAGVVFSKRIGDKFLIDIVDAQGPPLVYASRTGNPRIAFIGPAARIQTPAFVTAMNDELSISDDSTHKHLLSIFYRGGRGTPIRQLSTPDLAEFVARLGGEGKIGEPRLDFSYGEVVALIGKLADERMLVAGTDRPMPVNFVLQNAPGADRGVEDAPVIPDGQRPIDVPAGQPSASVR